VVRPGGGVGPVLRLLLAMCPVQLSGRPLRRVHWALGCGRGPGSRAAPRTRPCVDDIYIAIKIWAVDRVQRAATGALRDRSGSVPGLGHAVHHDAPEGLTKAGGSARIGWSPNRWGSFRLLRHPQGTDFVAWMLISSLSDLASSD
jgi:hypothetical protein